jgi:hypothetical protein
VSEIELTSRIIEVYDAALTANKDPTGGRGSGGPITEQLEEAHDKDIVRGAV